MGSGGSSKPGPPRCPEPRGASACRAAGDRGDGGSSRGCVRIRGPVAGKQPRSGGLSWDVYERGGEGLGSGGFSDVSACGDTEQPAGATALPAPGAYTSLDDLPLRGGFRATGCPEETAACRSPLAFALVRPAWRRGLRDPAAARGRSAEMPTPRCAGVYVPQHTRTPRRLVAAVLGIALSRDRRAVQGLAGQLRVRTVHAHERRRRPLTAIIAPLSQRLHVGEETPMAASKSRWVMPSEERRARTSQGVGTPCARAYWEARDPDTALQPAPSTW